jgi:Flp pilus assembly protein TadG
MELEDIGSAVAMRKSGLKTCRKRVRSTRASEVAETAMILPLLFVVLIAIYWFGQAFRIYGTITHAARQGARAAVAPACATCATSANSSVQNAINAVDNAMAAAHLDPAQLQPWTTSPALCACGSLSSSCLAGTVPCDSSVPSSNVCVQTNVRLSSTTPFGGAGTCGASVSLNYQYPFHFTLPCWPQPCNSLDLQKITLPAQAEMRSETQ